MQLIYCHTKPYSNLETDNSIEPGYYYYHSYYFDSMKCYDLKESNDIFSRTILSFRQHHSDNFFYSIEEFRDIKIKQLLS